MKNDKVKELKKFIIELIWVVVITTVVTRYIVGPVRVIGNSMNPTYTDGSFAIVNKLMSRFSIDRFDIVVVDSHQLDEYIIKRVIGLPGDTVKMENDILTINGVIYDEDYLDTDYVESIKRQENKNYFTEDFEVVVPEDTYFVLGDNRPRSHDSRRMGCIDKNEIIAVGAWTIIRK